MCVKTLTVWTRFNSYFSVEHQNIIQENAVFLMLLQLLLLLASPVLLPVDKKAINLHVWVGEGHLFGFQRGSLGTTDYSNNDLLDSNIRPLTTINK